MHPLVAILAPSAWSGSIVRWRVDVWWRAIESFACARARRRLWPDGDTLRRLTASRLLLRGALARGGRLVTAPGRVGALSSAASYGGMGVLSWERTQHSSWRMARAMWTGFSGWMFLPRRTLTSLSVGMCTVVFLLLSKSWRRTTWFFVACFRPSPEAGGRIGIFFRDLFFSPLFARGWPGSACYSLAYRKLGSAPGQSRVWACGPCQTHRVLPTGVLPLAGAVGERACSCCERIGLDEASGAIVQELCVQDSSCRGFVIRSYSR